METDVVAAKDGSVLPPLCPSLGVNYLNAPTLTANGANHERSLAVLFLAAWACTAMAAPHQFYWLIAPEGSSQYRVWPDGTAGQTYVAKFLVVEMKQVKGSGCGG